MIKPLLCSFLVTVIAGYSLSAFGQTRQPAANDKPLPANVKSISGFLPNHGQLCNVAGKPASEVKYLLRMPGMNVQLRAGGFSYDTYLREEGGTTHFHRVDISLTGANVDAAVVEELPTHEITNFIMPQGSFTGLRSYRKITYKAVYPGIDLQFETQPSVAKPFEYNFIVHPGADAAQIRLSYAGANNTDLQDGKIVMALATGRITESIPRSYLAGLEQSVAVTYQHAGDEAYAFHIGDYDKTETLVIDPTPDLVWGTYIGSLSSGAIDEVFGVATDGSGNVYSTGITLSNSNIATAGAYQASLAGSTDAFIQRYNTAGNLVWSTYFGGTGDDVSRDIATDAAGNLFIAGYTGSAGLATVGAFRTALNSGTDDGFLAKFTSAGLPVWFTYYGTPSTKDALYSVATDGAGNVYAAGVTDGVNGANNIASTGAYSTAPAGAQDQILMKFSNAGARIWGTYYGGTGNEGTPDLAVDPSGNVYVGSTTQSMSGIATAGAYQTTVLGGATYGYLVKFNTGGGRLWGTYYGAGNGSVADPRVAVDPTNAANVYFSIATSIIGMGTSGVHQTSLNGSADNLLTRFTSAGARVWATYSGGLRDEDGGGLAVDARGNPYLLGRTASTNLIATPGAYQTAIAGANAEDVYLQKFNPSGGLIWGTYYGGTDQDNPTSIAIDPNCNAFVGGYTYSATGLSLNGNQNASIAGGSIGNYDGFVGLIAQGYVPPGWTVTASTITANQTQTVCIGGFGVMIIGSDVYFNAPPGFSKPIFYQWQYSTSASGPWTNLPGETFRDLLPLVGAVTYYYRRQARAFINCDTSTVGTTPVATVTVNAFTAPTANTGGGAFYDCPGNSMTLGGLPSATGGTSPYTYAWYTATFPNLVTPFSTIAAPVVAPTVSTIYTLKVTDANGCVDYDQMVVTVVAADAGPDVSFCAGSAGVQIGTPPVPGNSYSWSPTSGLSCPACAQTVASPVSSTTYTLTMTTPTKGGGTCSTTDAVNVTNVGPPNGNAAFGGPDKTICRSAGGSLTPLGTAAATGYAYVWNPGNYLSNTVIAQPDFSTGINVQAVNCPMNYTVTATKAGCAFYDQVSVTMINEYLDLPGPACGPRWVGQAAPITCPGTTYLWTANDVYGVILSSNTGSSAYLKTNSAINSAVFTRTATLNAVSCAATATVSPTCGGGCGLIIGVLSKQSCAKVFPGLPLVLNAGGVNPAQYSFVWSDNLSGSPSAYVNNPYSPTVTVLTNLAITLTVTITDVLDPTHVCTASISVNNPGYTLPSFSAPDTGACPNANVAVGLTAIGGYSYLWTTNPTLSCTACSNPIANATTNQTYYVIITSSVAAGSCKSYDTVNLNISNLTVNAGPDRQVCNGGGITIGTPDPSLGAWQYSWAPPTMSGPYINGTTSTQPQPQVLFSGTTISFILNVTDPANNCSLKDTVVLSSTALTQGDAGPDKSTCPGAAIQIGNPAIPGCTYSWSPSVGLSCSTCAQPTVLNPLFGATYTVTVTYPGAPTYSACTVSDAMNLTILPVTAISFSNKAYCPGGSGVSIGGTVAGAISYAWSPAAGLSCINCASPTANPLSATVYTLTITFANGCTSTGNVTVTPTNPINGGPNQTICAGGPGVVIGQPSVGGVTYSWSPITGLSCTNCAQPTASPTSTTTYTLSANDGTCNAISTVTVYVITLPTLTVSGTANLCAGACSNFSVTSSTTGMSYTWSPLTGVSNPTSPNTTICPTGTTIYTLTQTGIASGCSSSLPVPVTVSANSAPTLVSTNSSMCAGSSVTLQLTVSPSGTYTFSWLPVAYLSNPFIQNPVAYPPVTTTYTVSVTNNATGCSNSTSVNVAVTPTQNCTLIDYGDAPASYNGAGGAFPPYATIDANIKVGANTDGEFAGYVASPGATPSGDDVGGISDEDGVGGFPMVTNSDNSYSVSLPSVYNNTGNPATAVAWIDWNGDGDFLDAGERSFLAGVPSSASTQVVTLTWLNYNNANQVVAGHTYMRLRISTDNTSSWLTNPQPTGGTADGEVEDYDLTILGQDWGDAQGYPSARATVNPDANNNGLPDATGSLWLGPKVDYAEYSDPATISAMGDDLNGIDDEDGLTIGGAITAAVPVNFNIVSNSVGTAVSRIGMWIDWNGDGDFTDANDQFYTTIVTQTGSPVTTTFSVTPPLGYNTAKYVVRLGIEPATAAAFTQASSFIAMVQNGEFEDYVNVTPLPLRLIDFSVAREAARTALLSWKVDYYPQLAGFSLSRSGNGTIWSEMANVPAVPDAASYSYRDVRPAAGMNYYRLALREQSGAVSYGPVRALLFDGAGSGFAVIGRPGSLTIRSNAVPTIYAVYAADGMLIGKGALTPDVDVVMPVSSGGVYLVRISDGFGNLVFSGKALVE